MADSTGIGPVGLVEIEIRARLGALEKDLAEAQVRLKKFDDDTKKSQSGVKGLEGAFSGVRAQLVALAAGMGPIGTFLVGLGPWGLAAAASLGLVEKALEHIKDKSREIGELALQLRNVGEATQFGIGPVMALQRAAGDLGIQTEQLDNWLQRMSFSLVAARERGTGPLVDALAALDFKLVEQIQNTKDNAEAWDVLAVAYQKAKAAGTGPEFLRQLGGRNAGSLGRVLDFSSQKGGMAALNEEYAKTNALTVEQAEKLGQLEAKIKSTREDADKLMASIWPESAVQRRLKAEEDWREFARLTKDITQGTDSLFTMLVETQARLFSSLPTWMGRDYLLDYYRKGAEGAKAFRDIQKDLNEKPRWVMGTDNVPKLVRPPGADFADRWKQTETAAPGTIGGAPRPEDAALAGALAERATQRVKALTDEKAATENASVAYNNYNRAIQVLGAATTLEEQYALALKKVDAALQADVGTLASQLGLTQEQARERMRAAATLDFQTKSQSALLGVLGTTATVEEQVLRTELALQTVEQQGIKITDERRAKIKQLAEAQANGTLAIQEQIDRLRVEMSVLNMAVGPAATYKLIWEATLKAIREGKTPEEVVKITAEVTKLANEAGRLEGNLSKAKFDKEFTQSLNQRAQGLEIEAKTYGMAIDAATSYKTAQEEINRRTADGSKLDEEETAEIQRKAKALGELEMASAKYKVQRDALYDRNLLFLMDSEAAIAQKLRGLYGDDIPKALASTEAAQMRFNDRLKEAMTNTTQFAQGYVRDIMAGKSATEALSNALKNLGAKLIDQGIEGGVKALFGGIFGGSVPGGIGGLKRGDTIGNPMFVQVVGGVGSLGGVAGTTAGVPGIPGTTGATPGIPGMTAPGISSPTTSGSGWAPVPASTGFSTAPQDVVVTGVGQPNVMPPILSQTGDTPIVGLGQNTGWTGPTANAVPMPLSSTAFSQLPYSYNGQTAPTRYNNPGGQYPSTSSAQYGSEGYVQLPDGNKIATFPSVEQGGAANMQTLANMQARNPIGTIGDITNKWSGGSRSTLAGYDSNTPLTADMTRDPAFMKDWMSKTAKAEGATPMTPAQIDSAFKMYNQGGVNAPGSSEITPFTNTNLANLPDMAKVNDTFKGLNNTVADTNVDFTKFGTGLEKFNTNIPGMSNAPTMPTTPGAFPTPGVGGTSGMMATNYGGPNPPGFTNPFLSAQTNTTMGAPTPGGFTTPDTGFSAPTSGFGGFQGSNAALPDMSAFNKSLTTAGTNVGEFGGKFPEVTTNVGDWSSGLTGSTTQLASFSTEGLAPAAMGLTNFGSTAVAGAATSMTSAATATTTMGIAGTTAATEISTLGAAAASSAASMGAAGAASGAGGAGGLAGLFAGLAEGGWPGAPKTGWIHGPGGPTGDKIPTMLSDTEFVVKSKQAKKYKPWVEAINEDRLDDMIKVRRRAEGGWVSNAIRSAANESSMHTGPAPQHQSNSDARGSEPSFKIVNTFDSAGFLENALASRGGEKVMLNFVRANQGTFRRAVGG